jgi:CspA family cold shock protein
MDEDPRAIADSLTAAAAAAAAAAAQAPQQPRLAAPPEAAPAPAACTLVMDEIVDRDVVGKYTGQVKWFNDRLGYGFCTICDGAEKGKDMFVHHTGIRPVNSNYKTLRKGEYVNFNLSNGHNGPQAVDVTGICGGSLMCDVLPIRRGQLLSTPPPPPPGRISA